MLGNGSTEHTTPMRYCYADTETYSECDLFACGAHRYAEDPSTEITVLAWALEGAEPVVEDLTGRRMPSAEFMALVDDPDVVLVFHNVGFDRTVMRHCWDLDLPIERFEDTMVRALAHGLPGALGKIGAALGVADDEAKDKKGRELIQLFAKPRPKNHKLRRASGATHPAEWALFLAYAGQDVVAMRAIHGKLPSWNYKQGHPEMALWHLDAKVNDRGIQIDLDLAHAAIEAVAVEQQRLKAETHGATGGAVRSPSQRDELLSYILLEHGVRLPDMGADTLRRRAEDPNLPDAVRLLLNIRLEATKTSTSKYKTAVKATSSDGRLRATQQFCGAARTGRVAHRLFQPGNMPRPSKGFNETAQELAIESLKAGTADMLYDDVMRLTADCIRGLIVAPPGRKLCVADLSNIEGRVLAFLAGEHWKLQSFREFDRGNGPDIYKLAYARSFGVAAGTVDKDQRQIGKVQELMLGYEGGVGAYLTGAATYNFKIADVHAAVFNATEPEVWRDKLASFEWFQKKGLTYGLPVEHWAACRVLVDSWREAHPNTRALWSALKEAFISSVARRGETFAVGQHLKVRADGAWLRIRLPSGRYLCYLSPEVDDDGNCSFMGVDQYTRQWKRIRTHGGKLVENCLAGYTEVLTPGGWMKLENITGQRVWDGVEWVQHGGLHYSGKQTTISNYGVRMTPDHLVLTTEGWRRASSCQGLERLHCRLPDADDLRRIGRQEVPVVRAVPLRQDDHTAGERSGQAEAARCPGVVRVHEARHDFGEDDRPRHEQAPGVCGVAQHDRPLHTAFASGLAQLRRAWDHGLRGVARVVRGFLARHGVDVPARPDPGTGGQHGRVRAGQLRVGDLQEAGQQHPAVALHRYAQRQNDGEAGVRSLRRGLLDAAVPTDQQLAGGPRVEPVYDLLNCGPRSRFTVRGPDGVPFIVHNCTQAAARDVLYANMPAIEAAGYAITLSVHDELLTETPDTSEFSAEHLAAMMSTVPPWAKGLPLAAAGFETRRYRKD